MSTASTSDTTPADAPFAFRPAREADLPALTDIYNAAVSGTDFTGHLAAVSVQDRLPWWRAHQDPRFPVLVAEDSLRNDGTVLGYASLSAWADGFPVYDHTTESSLYLAPAAQGRGLGTALMRALLAEAARVGHHVVLSRIWSGNAPSLAMCRKCGYEVVGVQREVGLRHGKWEDCVLMQVIL